jgi:hypothetical protein
LARVVKALEPLRVQTLVPKASVERLDVGIVDGEFTAADIMMGYSIFLADLLKVMDDDEYSNVIAYFAHLKERPRLRQGDGLTGSGPDQQSA